MKLQIEIGKRIKQIRKALNLTQEDFCKYLDTSKASLSEIENGKYKAGNELLEKLVKKYNVNLHFVIVGEGDMFISTTASPVSANSRSSSSGPEKEGIQKQENRSSSIRGGSSPSRLPLN